MRQLSDPRLSRGGHWSQTARNAEDEAIYNTSGTNNGAFTGISYILESYRTLNSISNIIVHGSPRISCKPSMGALVSLFSSGSWRRSKSSGKSLTRIEEKVM